MAEPGSNRRTSTRLVLSQRAYSIISAAFVEFRRQDPVPNAQFLHRQATSILDRRVEDERPLEGFRGSRPQEPVPVRDGWCSSRIAGNPAGIQAMAAPGIPWSPHLHGDLGGKSFAFLAI